jgi:hypothetical protein
MPKLIAVGVAAFALASPVAALAQQAPRQTATDHWSSTTPGTSSGRMYAVDFVNPIDPSGKPPSVSHVHLQLPSGARFDTDAVAQCPASDAELMLMGAAACPAASGLGVGSIIFDTGLPGPGRYLKVSITFFNEHDQLILLTQDASTGLRTVSRATVTASTLDADLPFLPGTPPDGAADEHERATFLAVSTPAGNYLTTPPTCPATHRWVERETYTYRDGVSQSVDIAEPCQPPASKPSGRTPSRPARGHRHPGSRPRSRRSHHRAGRRAAFAG